MSCDITNGRVEECKDSISGLKSIFFANFDSLANEESTGAGVIGIDYNVTDTDVIDTWQSAAALTLYKYELKSNSNSFNTTIETSRDNGTTFFTQTLVINLKKQDFAMHKNIKLLAYGRPRIIVRTMTDQFFLMGLAQGCDTTAGEISSGAAMGDFNGYSLTFVAMEVSPANFINVDTQAGLALAFADIAGTDAVIETT
tara:strand:+ start:1099 stop:1695 length:597 start_codon:yes stop_codon:yes gene_type:complete